MSWSNLIPEKVFIERDGPYYEYSDTAPSDVERRLNGLFEGALGYQNMYELYYCLPEVRGAVNVIATAVSDAVWELRMFKDDKVIYDDKNFNRLFYTPNPLESFRAFIYNAVCHEILGGRQFFYFNRPSTLASTYDNILSWYNLPAKDVEIEKVKGYDLYSSTELTDIIKSYKVGQRTFEVDRVLPILHTSLNNHDLNNCKSPLLGARKAIENLIPVYEARKMIYVKRGAMGMWVSRKSDASGSVALNETEKRNIRTELDNSYGLTGNKSTVGISAQQVDFVKTSISLAEMLPFEETLADAVAIFSALGIPRSLVPSKDQGTFNNVNDDRKGFYTGVVMPWAQKYADAFTKFFNISEKGNYINASFGHISALQNDLVEKANVSKIKSETAILLYEKGVITKNERNVMVDTATTSDGDVFAGDKENPDPLAVRLGVGGTQALQSILTDPALDKESKVQALIILFGIQDSDARKMVSDKKIENGNSNNENQTTGSTDQLQ